MSVREMVMLWMRNAMQVAAYHKCRRGAGGVDGLCLLPHEPDCQCDDCSAYPAWRAEQIRRYEEIQKGGGPS
jgi:hypothetical protein